MSKNMFNGGNLRWHSVWKRRLNACAVWHTHVAKLVDNACTYRYHHCVSQYLWYRIFGIVIGPPLVCVCVCSLIPGILSVWLEVGVSLLCSTGGQVCVSFPGCSLCGRSASLLCSRGGCGCVCMCVHVPRILAVQQRWPSVCACSLIPRMLDKHTQ